MPQEMALWMTNDVINGFSLQFCTKLLRKLNELVVADKVFQDGISNAVLESSDNPRLGSRTTTLACVVLRHLSENTGVPIQAGCTNPDELEEFLQTIGEFLAIFDEEPSDTLIV